LHGCLQLMSWDIG